MSKLTTFCMIGFLLLFTLSCAFAQDVTPMETYHGDNEGEKVEVEESCEGIGEDECLMRRTLAAHVDYIYTQKQKQP